MNPNISIPGNVDIIAVAGLQWGDEGKGKFVHAIGDWAEITIRCNGGDNAGHTVYPDGKKRVLHTVPSSIFGDRDGKVSVIGSGVAFNPMSTKKELTLLASDGFPYNRLMISHRALLVLPHHIVLDQYQNAGSRTIGSTGHGIGPTYVAHVNRCGLVVNDLLNKDTFRKKLQRFLELNAAVLDNLEPELVNKALSDATLGNGIFSDNRGGFDSDTIIDSYCEMGKFFDQFIRDTDAYMKEAASKRKKILLEGAQAVGLDIDHGTYPYVTSSRTTPQGLAEGAGIAGCTLDLVLGVTKAYPTRVGRGTFPTEMGGEKSAQWCAMPDVTRELEKERFSELSINDANDFHQGIALRIKAGEYGSTTARPRRPGYLDLPWLRYATEHTGARIALTRLDIFSGFDTIKVCTGYIYEGPDYRFGGKTFRSGDYLKVAVPDIHVLEHCKPVYTKLRGWNEDLQNVRSRRNLPLAAQEYAWSIEQGVGATVGAISVGPEPDQSIWCLE